MCADDHELGLRVAQDLRRRLVESVPLDRPGPSGSGARFSSGVRHV
jgi:hypothetical protein